MIRKTNLAAAFAFTVGLPAAGMAPAQTASPAAPAASAQAAPPPAPSTLQRLQAETPPIKPSDPNTNQPTYAVDPPPQGASGVYLPSAVLGYAKSAAGCVVIGCDDGPQAGGSAGPSSSGQSSPAPATPPPANPGSPAP
jgi:hypothetical protein